jgi:peptidoglycan LD-endopeptidase CwlK
MNTTLDSLDPMFKPLAFALLARLTEARIPVVIVNTRRTDSEQADAIARHVSWVIHSKHQDGLAIDIAPFETYVAHGMNKILWDGSDPVWLRIGQIGEALGLRWGGRWTVKDWGHFEYVWPQSPGTPV